MAGRHVQRLPPRAYLRKHSKQRSSNGVDTGVSCSGLGSSFTGDCVSKGQRVQGLRRLEEVGQSCHVMHAILKAGRSAKKTLCYFCIFRPALVYVFGWCGASDSQVSYSNFTQKATRAAFKMGIA